MPNTSYMSQPLTDWSSEISAPQTAASPAPGMTGPFQYPPASMPADMPPAFQFPPAGTSAGSSGTPAPSRPAAPPASAAPSPAGAAASTDSTGPAGSTGSTSPTGSSGSTSSAGAAASAGPVSSVPAVRPPARHPAHNEFAGSTGDLDLRNHQPAEVIEAPTTTGEAFLGSLKAMLLRNRGNFVAATLLIGTQGTMVWEGILHEVGNDYFIIYQTGRQRYILCDIYALKYMEFYDTKQRELCEHLLQENGSQGFC
ncbi:MAG: hypothetical protein HFF93_03115 [Oscillibacter sp.]|uniref:hypothetical protein n=1 Tax=Oscillibacter sp. TaxID=1945593 RepID=UPI00216E313D|nr:hypothetical protein [Oscillibacter sp.]MCI9113074.1 hypothetical protein [Oscillibacter sp.]MCI9300036.1 hypothetical protein [Oscillibacter sp.]MCI9460823.1 hypothetical protein [Oscillibacter sp.]